MRSASRKLLFYTAALIAMTAAAFGQSLGDVAREQRQKQQAKTSQAVPKVITNEDLGEPEDSTPQASSAESKQDVPHSSSLGSRSAEQWKSQIEAQKRAIAALQKRIDEVNSSVHFARASATWREVQHNERQEQKLDQVQQMQNQLAAEQKKLEDMQESARREGFGSSVYDPN